MDVCAKYHPALLRVLLWPVHLCGRAERAALLQLLVKVLLLPKICARTQSRLYPCALIIIELGVTTTRMHKYIHQRPTHTSTCAKSRAYMHAYVHIRCIVWAKLQDQSVIKNWFLRGMVYLFVGTHTKTCMCNHMQLTPNIPARLGTHIHALTSRSLLGAEFLVIC